MSRFYELPVKQVRQETADSISIEFDVPEEHKSTFQYLSGQYLTLKVNVNGEQVRRPYSLCSSPVVDDAPKVTSKRVDGGKVSNFLNDNLKTGDTLEVFPPRFWYYSALLANEDRPEGRAHEHGLPFLWKPG
jgi:ring-1,2-phenylacetyl-CoA epoxidase subunit PaaE